MSFSFNSALHLSSFLFATLCNITGFPLGIVVVTVLITVVLSAVVFYFYKAVWAFLEFSVKAVLYSIVIYHLLEFYKSKEYTVFIEATGYQWDLLKSEAFKVYNGSLQL